MKCKQCGHNSREVITWFAANLIEYRRKHKLTQIELAERMGISNCTLSRWEHDQWPRLGTFCRACRRAGIKPMVLIGDYFKERPKESG